MTLFTWLILMNLSASSDLRLTYTGHFNVVGFCMVAEASGVQEVIGMGH